jgi:hypothetical protein
MTAPVSDEAWTHIYRAEATKVNDLVHTKLELKPDYGFMEKHGSLYIRISIQPIR